MSYDLFGLFKPTTVKVTGMFAAAMAMHAYAVTSESHPAFMAALILTSASILYGSGLLLNKVEPYLPTVFRPSRSAPAA